MSEITFKQRVDLGKQSSMMIWYPQIKQLPIPQIKTEIIVTGHKVIYDWLYNKIPIPDDVWKMLYSSMNSFNKYPIFMRTDQSSAKHSWKDTCFLESKDRLQHNLSMLIEEHEMQNMAGELGYEAIVFREFLDLETSFTCFYGDFPVNKEVRCFIKDGKIESLRHYWVKNAIADGSPEDKDWESKLEKLKALTEEDILEIKRQLLLACRIFPEYWSVDFAKSKDGTWHLIDMARGEVSYQSDEIIK